MIKSEAKNKLFPFYSELHKFVPKEGLEIAFSMLDKWKFTEFSSFCLENAKEESPLLTYNFELTDDVSNRIKGAFLFRLAFYIKYSETDLDCDEERIFLKYMYKSHFLPTICPQNQSKESYEYNLIKVLVISRIIDSVSSGKECLFLLTHASVLMETIPISTLNDFSLQFKIICSTQLYKAVVAKVLTELKIQFDFRDVLEFVSNLKFFCYNPMPNVLAFTGANNKIYVGWDTLKGYEDQRQTMAFHRVVGGHESMHAIVRFLLNNLGKSTPPRDERLTKANEYEAGVLFQSYLLGAPDLDFSHPRNLRKTHHSRLLEYYKACF